MKRLLFKSLSIILLSFSITSKNDELYTLTDYFIDQLSTEVESYGLLSRYEKMTKDKKYQVKTIGRLINVKIMKPAGKTAYEQLRKDLTTHYEDDDRVQDVYICQAGTVMIDCRHEQ